MDFFPPITDDTGNQNKEGAAGEIAVYLKTDYFKNQPEAFQNISIIVNGFRHVGNTDWLKRRLQDACRREIGRVASLVFRVCRIPFTRKSS